MPLNIFTAYVLGALTVVGVILALAIIDWLKSTPEERQRLDGLEQDKEQDHL